MLNNLMDQITPLPRALMRVAGVVIGILAAAKISIKGSQLSPLPVVLLLVGGLFMTLAWNAFTAASKLNGSQQRESGADRRGLLYLVIGIFFCVTGAVAGHSLLIGTLLIIAVAVLIWIVCFPLRISSQYKVFIIPVILCLSFVTESVILGYPQRGIFPGFLTGLFYVVVHVTDSIERKVSGTSDEVMDLHIVYRHTLGLTSVIFFFFGVISLWPWLGEMYSNWYLAVVMIGVLIPSWFLWERLRQPKKDNSFAALRRFNRIIPYLTVLLLIAFLVA